MTNKFLIVFVFAALFVEKLYADEQNVTEFIITNTYVPQTVNKEWKQNCPNLFCGPDEKKWAMVQQVFMNKESGEKVLVRGTVVAEASFGLLSPLDDKQVITVMGEANPVACTFRLASLKFADGVAQFLVDLFSDLEGKLYPFKDKHGKCDHFFPKNL